MELSEYLPLLPADMARYVLEQLRQTLPPPVPDTPEARAEREHRSFCAIAELRPANAADAMLASQIVLASAVAADCLRRAEACGDDVRVANANRSLARQFLREEKAARKLLQQIQKANAARKRVPWPIKALRPGLWERDPTAPPPRGAPPLDAKARAERAARIRAIDLRVIETPPTRH